jgi:hypothetical protein
MRYVVVDLQGNQRGSFDSRSELVSELREGLLADPASLRSLYVLTEDASGQEIAPAERGDEVLAGAVHSLALVAVAMEGWVGAGSATTQILRTERSAVGVVDTRPPTVLA